VPTAPTIQIKGANQFLSETQGGGRQSVKWALLASNLVLFEVKSHAWG